MKLSRRRMMVTGVMGGHPYITRPSKLPNSVSWVDLGILTLSKELNDVTPSGILLADRGAGPVSKSSDDGANWADVKYTPPGTTNFPGLLQAVIYLADGNLLASTRDAKLHKSNAITWDTGFTPVCTMTPGTLTGANNCNFGLTTYQNVVLACEYASPVGDKVWGSLDYGATFTNIFTMPVLSGTHHVHNAVYDPYENKVWVVAGDGTTNRMIYYSSDFGVSWIQLCDFGSLPFQFINIIPLPECILFGTDVGASVGYYRLRRRRGVYNYKLIQLEPAYIYLTGATGNIPWASRAVTTYGVDACAYVSFLYYYDTQTILLDLYATRDGQTFTKICTPPTPSGNGNKLGIVNIMGPTNGGYLYFYFGNGTAGYSAAKVAVPTWS